MGEAPLMFERFSDEARHVVVRAQEAAGQLRHDYVGTEHLLLGLAAGADPTLSSFGVTSEALVGQVLREIGPGRPGNAAALASIGIDLAEVRRRVEEAFGPGALERTRAGGGFCRERRLTPRSKKTLELAAREALRLGDGHVGAEHLLLGVLSVREGVAVKLLENLGVSPERMRGAVLDRLGRAA
jgi:ATP-dependent Clp protease ATP-binding subunit ClpA